MAIFFFVIVVSYILNIKHNVMTKKKTSPVKIKSEPKRTYRPVSKNIYYDGFSYRVRMSINGVGYSKNFSSKKNAVQFRNELQRKSQFA